MSKERFIVHVDMDAFYASIEQRDNPSLRNKPVIVGADPKGGAGRGVVSASSYEARRFGIHSAMPITRAYRRCPQAVFLPVDMPKYVRESRRVFEVLNRFTPMLEPLSIDEAFLDITNSYHLFGTPAETCRKIMLTIKQETGLTASVGLAPNKHTAKIASDMAKPDGFLQVEQEELFDFLHPLPVERIWGIGEKSKQAFKAMGIHTVGDLARQDLRDILHSFGKLGEHAWRLANGIDPREVHVQPGVKSIGHEHTFDVDETLPDKVLDVLMSLCEAVSRRLRKAGLRGSTVTLKIRFADFKTHTRSITIQRPTNFVDEIFALAAQKTKDFELGTPPVRLIGVQVSGLEKSFLQPDLFEQSLPEDQRKERLHQALDEIKNRFGEKAIKRR